MFRKCIYYLALLGISSFYIGRILPKKWFHSDWFPFRCFAIEKNGKIYEAIGIKRWKDRLPDMSKIFSRIMLPKKVPFDISQDKVMLLIQETCIAEFTHVLLSVLGIGCFFIWPGTGGMIVFLIWLFVGNLPYILIQRYNRPRLCKLAEQMTGEIAMAPLATLE